MTVIIATRKAMYSDSICTTEETNYPTVKIFRVKGSLIGTAGTNKHIERFMRWYRGSHKKPFTPEDGDDSAIIVLDKQGRIWDWSGTSMPDEVLRDYHGAGVGWPAAHAALIMGADPPRAIEVACKVSHLCALPVQEFRL